MFYYLSIYKKLILLNLIIILITIDALHLKRIYAIQREIPQKIKHIQRDIKSKLIICYKGKIIRGICVCDQNYFGKFCEREMHCLGFERTENGSCYNCKENYFGENCDKPLCKYGGIEDEYTQKCKCISPHSGKYCEELRVENVYYHYNSRAYIIGPIGVLLIIPMVICFIVCERNARRRQINRIHKTWANELENKKEKRNSFLN
ncbi:EGF-like domain-containing protein [Meloidogyne graminicola]|uniref:EGF-like domain-containing protein n=1 Tax=Meloidogyne graminicola TaxID=189291 RepID=A0A8S9ZRP8_9BILA|nr:EGF-like domain-containing protein [Meloidogyne graminicola]